MRDELDDARALLPDVRLEVVDTLPAGDRARVWRVRAQWPDRDPSTLVVKIFGDPGEGWARETAALSIAPADAPVAQVVAAGQFPPVVIMSDAGEGASVADAMLGDDPGVATEAVLMWSQAIGELHACTAGLRSQFRDALAARSRELSDVVLSAAADEAVRRLDDHCGALGITVPHHALSELRELPRRLNGDGAAALTPHDTCPDNNARVGDRLVLLDFEDAQWRHIAWDVAYLFVPWPSCWCSWRIPGELADRALERYRRTVEGAFPYVRDPQFRHDVTMAATGWALITTSWFLPNALRDEAPSLNPDRPTPTRRAMLMHRLDRARRCEELPAVAELADRLHTALTHRWGEVHLALAPAFADDR
jgi:hypothetical protein